MYLNNISMYYVIFLYMSYHVIHFYSAHSYIDIRIYDVLQNRSRTRTLVIEDAFCVSVHLVIILGVLRCSILSCFNDLSILSLENVFKNSPMFDVAMYNVFVLKFWWWNMVEVEFCVNLCLKSCWSCLRKKWLPVWSVDHLEKGSVNRSHLCSSDYVSSICSAQSSLEIMAQISLVMTCPFQPMGQVV